MNIKRHPVPTSRLTVPLGLLVLLAATVSGPAATAAPAKTSEFCKAAVAAIAAPPPNTPNDPAKLTAAENTANKTYANLIISSIDTMLAANVADIAADLRGRRAELAKVAKDGLTPQNPTAGLGRSSTIANAVAKQCATVRLNVTATDFRFSGIPNRVSAGLASVTLKNASKSEPHHLLMVRKKPGITTPAKELLEKDDDATMDFVTGTDDVKPGQTTVGIAYLTPGTYVVADFLPVGGKEGGQPHFTKGMYFEFTIK